MRTKATRYALLAALLFSAPMWVGSASAENLYKPGQGQNLIADIKANKINDTITVIIVQTAEARNSARNVTDRSNRVQGGITTPGTNEFADFSVGRNYSGLGEVRRSESFVTQMSATVVDVFPNGDLQVEGVQFLEINGETTRIEISGRVRPVDVEADNTVLSSRIADATIRYDGEGFVSDSARQGLIGRIFNALGLF